MFIPALREARLHIALIHVESFPVDVGAGLADENAKRHIEVRALAATALNAVGVESVL